MSEQEQETNVVEFAPMEFPLVEYGVTDAALAELAERYADPDAGTDDGYEHCKNGCRELTALRTGVETRRLDLKRPVVDWIRTHIDNRGKELIRRIRKIEEPVRAEKERIDEVKQAEARKAAEAEQKRIDGIKADIEKIAATAREQNIDATAADYQQHIKWLGALVISKLSFAEFAEEASTARDAALFKLTQWHEQALQRETDDRKRAEDRAALDKQRKKQEATEKKQREAAEKIEKEKREAAARKAAEKRAAQEKTEREEAARKREEERRITDIKYAIDVKRTIPNRARGSNSEPLGRLIVAEKEAEPTKDNFAEFLPEAIKTWQDSITALEVMAKDAREFEEKARRDEEARLPDKDKLLRWCEAIATIPEPEVLNDKAQKTLRRYAGDLSKFIDRLRSDIGKL